MSSKLILIDRQYGSGGREIGKKLAEKLDIPFYDGEMLYIAAERFGLNPGVLEQYDEKNVKSMIYMIAMTAEHQVNGAGTLPQNMYNAMAETILRLAKDGQCVIMGRCADYILKDKADYVSVYVHASDMKKRIERAIDIDGVTRKDVEGYIKKKDKQRRDYYNFYTDGKWGEAKNYDICLDTSTIGYDKCVEIIMSLL